ncbi:hypothetical protein NHX12_005102, partial [Muraenolepis orangiensis]
RLHPISSFSLQVSVIGRAPGGVHPLLSSALHPQSAGAPHRPLVEAPYSTAKELVSPLVSSTEEPVFLLVSSWAEELVSPLVSSWAEELVSPLVSSWADV